LCAVARPMLTRTFLACVPEHALSLPFRRSRTEVVPSARRQACTSSASRLTGRRSCCTACSGLITRGRAASPTPPGACRQRQHWQVRSGLQMKLILSCATICSCCCPVPTPRIPQMIALAAEAALLSLRFAFASRCRVEAPDVRQACSGLGLAHQRLGGSTAGASCYEGILDMACCAWHLSTISCSPQRKLLWPARRPTWARVQHRRPSTSTWVVLACRVAAPLVASMTDCCGA
jgi:hypothetical protein